MSWKAEWHEAVDAEAMISASVNPGFVLASVFQHPTLIRAWLKTKGSALGLMPALAILEHGSSQVLMPLVVRTTLGLRRAVMVGEPHFDYQIPMTDALLDWPQFWSSMWRPLARRGRLADLLVRRLPERFVGSAGNPDPDVETAILQLDGCSDLDAYLATRGANLRSDVRRRLRRANELGGIRLSVFSSDEVEPARAAFAAMRAAYEELHRSEPSGRMFQQPGTAEFYLELIEQALPLGLLHFSVLSIGGRDAAWHFGFLYDRVLHWYKPTYAPWAAHLAPGKLMLAELVRFGIAERWHAIDFGGGTEPYKAQWGNRTEALRSLRFFGPTLGGWLLRQRH